MAEPRQLATNEPEKKIYKKSINRSANRHNDESSSPAPWICKCRNNTQRECSNSCVNHVSLVADWPKGVSKKDSGKINHVRRSYRQWPPFGNQFAHLWHSFPLLPFLMPVILA
jgi:hypothetical protein